MAKPRKQKSDEQKHENSGGVVLHQKLCISVDMENRRVYGHTEMKVVVPESGVIALHADNMIINKITVDGKDAEFECVPHYQFADDESSWSSVSCSKSAADAACSSYISSLNRETSANLIITCCNKSKEPQSNMGLNVPENIIQSSCAEQVVNGCNELPQDKDVKVICIDYWLDQTETGIHFGERLLHTDNQIRRVHCWFPCMYTSSQHCLFDLEFTVSSNFVAVSNGDLLYQQSAAFKILKTRLKTMPPHTLVDDQVKWRSSGNPNTQILEVTEHGSNIHDQGNMHIAINFASRLQQFKNVQNLHRMHSRNAQFPLSSTTAMLSQIQISEELRPPVAHPEVSHPPPRSSWTSSGQFHQH